MKAMKTMKTTTLIACAAACWVAMCARQRRAGRFVRVRANLYDC